MNLHLLIIYVLGLALAIMALADEPITRHAGFDIDGRFTVTTGVPPGFRNAVLETTTDLSAGTAWRGTLAAALDGRAAEIRFRIPTASAPRMFARVRLGTGTTIPPVELSDPELVSVTYPGDLDEQAKIDFLVLAGARMREWAGLPRAERRERLVAWALASPLISAARTTDLADDITLRFTDGELAILTRRPRSSDDVDQEAPSDHPPGAAAKMDGSGRTLTGPVYGIPSSNRAVVAFSLEPKFPNSAPTVGQWLGNNGYSPSRFDSTSVEQILSWSSPGNPLGVLFWHAHGCPFVRDDGSKGIAIVTGQFATAYYSRNIYSPMLRSGELVLAKDDSQALPWYAITKEFVRRNMHFADHSLVVMDTCFGADPELANAFIGANAGSYGSWDWLSGDQSGDTCLKVFDRLLGTNSEPPVSVPKERSFSLPTVIGWMSMMGYDIDPSPQYKNQGRRNARLQWYHHSSKSAHILRPSVMRILHEFGGNNEPFTKLLIEGDFGTDPGPANRTVTWGGVPMPVLRWDDFDGITIKPPASPPSGDIQVIIHKDFYSYSNAAPVSEWGVPFTYEYFGEGSLYAKMVMNVKFRGDIHGSRGAPEMPVQYLPMPFVNLGDCGGPVTASGTFSPEPGTTITWSGGSSLSSDDYTTSANEPLEGRIVNYGTLDMANGRIHPFDLRASGSLTETEKTTHPDGTVTTRVYPSGIGFAGFTWPIIPPRLNPASGALIGETRNYPGNGTSARLTWPTVVPQAAPTAATAR